MQPLRIILHSRLQLAEFLVVHSQSFYLGRPVAQASSAVRAAPQARSRNWDISVTIARTSGSIAFACSRVNKRRKFSLASSPVFGLFGVAHVRLAKMVTAKKSL